MNQMTRMWALIATLLIPVGIASASPDAITANLFRRADQSSAYFAGSYGYAVFPTIGKGGLGIGAAHGDGHVYVHGKSIGRVAMTQLSIGFQAGGEAYSEIIFFKDKKALDKFTSGKFEFSGDVGAIAITAAAHVSVGTTGTHAGASVGKRDAASASEFTHGMAVFTIAKGGLMYNVAVAGQKFTFHGRSVG